MATPRKTAATVQAEFDAFKQKVVDKAMEIKNREGYCDAVDEFLEEAGLELPVPDDVFVVVQMTGREYKEWLEDVGDDTDSDPAEVIKRRLDRYADFDIKVESADGFVYVD